MADAMHMSLTVTLDGQGYSLIVADRSRSSTLTTIARMLESMLDEALKEAREVPFELGRVWRVREGASRDNAPPAPEWEGTWTRRGQSNTFDGVFHNQAIGDELHDTIQLESAASGRVTLYRVRMRQRYYGRYDPLQQGVVNGTADWFGPGVAWRADIER
jgi:hypothetical protein